MQEAAQPGGTTEETTGEQKGRWRGRLRENCKQGAGCMTGADRNVSYNKRLELTRRRLGVGHQGFSGVSSELWTNGAKWHKGETRE